MRTVVLSGCCLLSLVAGLAGCGRKPASERAPAAAAPAPARRPAAPALDPKGTLDRAKATLDAARTKEQEGAQGL